MTAATAGPEVAAADHPTLREWASDTSVITRRELIRMTRSIEVLVFALIQPIMFVLLFRYVFGGSIQIPGMSYVTFLIPGIAVQTLAFGSYGTGMGIATDLQKGVIDRFRSLPMARSAVLAGRICADLVQATLILFIIVVIGIVVGFRPDGPVLGYVAAVPLMLGITMAFCWISAVIALSVRTVEAVGSAGLIWLFPLSFLSSAFVRPESMPAPLEAFADVNPFTIFCDAVRALAIGGETAAPVLGSIAWIALITGVAAPLAVRKFRDLT